MKNKITKLSALIIASLFVLNLQGQEFKYKKKLGKYIFKTMEGDYDYDLAFDDVSDAYNSLFKVKEGEKWGLLDREGDLVTAIQFDVIESHFKLGYIVKKNDKFGFLNEKGEVILDIVYDEIDSFDESKGVVKKDGIWGIVENNEFRVRGK